VLAMDGANMLMEEMINRGLTPTVVTYTDLIIGYYKTGDERKAKMMYKSMLQAGITPDAKMMCILGLDNCEDDFEDSQKQKGVL
jgi:pentatricopeptide repeat protein